MLKHFSPFAYALSFACGVAVRFANESLALFGQKGNERIFAATPLMITAFIIPANHHYNKHTWQPGQCQVVVEFLVDRPKVLSDQLSDMPRSRPNFRSMFCVPLLPSKIGMPFSNMLKSRAPSHASFMIRSAYPP